jgi:hypothetical protein
MVGITNSVTTVEVISPNTTTIASGRWILNRSRLKGSTEQGQEQLSGCHQNRSEFTPAPVNGHINNTFAPVSQQFKFVYQNQTISECNPKTAL